MPLSSIVNELIPIVDYTLLNPKATIDAYAKHCDDAARYPFASVCVPPSMVHLCVDRLKGAVPVCTVAGFPNGYNTTAAKVFEAKQAIDEGAAEIDMVINVGHLLSGEVDLVRDDIAKVKLACGSNVLKVIIETCLLTREAKIAACKAVTEAGADYIKTSTGFAGGGAVIDDIVLMREHVGESIKIKAAGGIKTLEFAHALRRAGADRLGMSSVFEAFGLG